MTRGFSPLEREFRTFARMRKIILFAIGFIFSVIVLFYIAAGVLIFKSADAISEVGLKGAIERVWCGKEVNCIDATKATDYLTAK